MHSPVIYLALTDDWELRGDGSGDIRELQFEPMRRLLQIYERHGILTTFMVEVMQQLTFRREQDRHPELRPMADEWDEHVGDAYRRGHDIQLHIHPQWSDATYSDGKWNLTGPWELSRYSAETTREMVSTGKELLEHLLKPLNAAYRCRAFRAGASAIGPGPFILPTLSDNGIDLDISIIKGYRMKTKNLDIDFTVCPEGRLPYYPQMDDARRISNKPGPIACMPLFQFSASRRALSADIFAKVRQRLVGPGKGATDYSSDQWDAVDSGKIRQVLEKVVMPVVKGKSIVGDIGKLGARFLPEVLPAARRLARESGLSSYPVVLSNHSKHVKDFAAIDRFVSDVALASDVHCVTLSEMAGMIVDGRLPARTDLAQAA